MSPLNEDIPFHEIWAPNAGRQTQFYTHPARTVGYGGSAGSGKSAAMLNHHWYILAFENQRYERGEISKSRAWCVYFRRTTPNLQQAWDHAVRLFPLADRREDMRGWNQSDLIYTYQCGLKYKFAHIEKLTDYYKYYSFEFVEQDWDELTEFEEEQFDQLGTRLRTSDPHLTRFLNVRWGSNPVGPGLEWVRRRFVSGRESGRTYRVPIKLGDGRIIYHDEVFIQAFLKDNPYLDADGQYEAALRRNKPHIAATLLQGNWYHAKGNFLGQFWSPQYHICENHDIPPHVFRFRSMDFGIHAHSSITWWYVDADGCFTAYFNLYIKELTAPQLAERIREVERHFGDWNEDEDRSMLNFGSPLDAQCFKRAGNSGPTIAEDFRRRGITWQKSSKDRKNGLAEVCKRLATYLPLDGKAPPRGQDLVDKKPLARWMKRCEAPLKYLPIVPADPLRPGEVNLRYKHLHTLDDSMFAFMTRPLLGSQANDNADDYDEDEDDIKAWRRRNDSRRIASIF